MAQYAGPDNAMQVTLVAAYASTAGDVAADDERRHGGGSQSSWRGRSASEFEAVCFFDAPIFGIAPRASSVGPSPATGYDRLEEIVRPDGVPVVYVAGFQRNLAVRPMPSATP